MLQKAQNHTSATTPRQNFACSREKAKRHNRTTAENNVRLQTYDSSQGGKKAAHVQDERIVPLVRIVTQHCGTLRYNAAQCGSVRCNAARRRPQSHDTPGTRQHLMRGQEKKDECCRRREQEKNTRARALLPPRFQRRPLTSVDTRGCEEGSSGTPCPLSCFSSRETTRLQHDLQYNLKNENRRRRKHQYL